MKIKFLVLISSLIFYSNISFSIDTKAGTSSLAFLKITPGARPSGMGDAFTAVSDDINSLYCNPAGLAKIENTIQATFTQNFYLAGINYNYAGGVFKTEKFSVGGGITILNTGNIEGFDINGLPYKYTAGDTCLSVSGAMVLQHDLLYAGGTLKTISEKLDTESASTISFDAGVIYKMSEQFSFAGVIQNLGSGVKFISDSFSQPFTIKAGVGYFSEEYVETPYKFAIDLVIPSDNSPRINFGGELKISPVLTARAGLKLGPGGNDNLGSLSGFTGGLGVKLEVGENTGLFLDFALIPYGNAGNSLRASATLKF